LSHLITHEGRYEDFAMKTCIRCGAVPLIIGALALSLAAAPQKAPAAKTDAKTEAPPTTSQLADDEEGRESIARLVYGPNRWIALHFLLQPQGRFVGIYEENLETSRDGIIQKELYLKRCRIILNGHVTKNISFFMETEDWEAGRSGSNANNGGYTTSSGYTSKDKGYDSTVTPADDYKHRHTVTTTGTVKNNTFTQTAFINYRIFDELQFTVGLIPLPFTRQNLQSAASLLGVDYAAPFVDAAIGGTTNNWRDMGAQVRGFLFGGIVDYKIGAFKGVSRSIERDENGAIIGITNPHDNPRYSGRIQINFLDPEPGFFYSGNYLGKRKIISLGGGVDYQQSVYRKWYYDSETGERTNSDLINYFAWTADVTVDYGFRGGNSFVFQGGYVGVYNNPATASLATDYYYNGSAFYVESGFLFKRIVQPVLKYQSVFQRAVHADFKDRTYEEDRTIAHYIVGLNFFIREHNANIKMEYAMPNGNNTSWSGQKWFIIQCQLFL